MDCKTCPYYFQCGRLPLFTHLVKEGKELGYEFIENMPVFFEDFEVIEIL